MPRHYCASCTVVQVSSKDEYCDSCIEEILEYLHKEYTQLKVRYYCISCTVVQVLEQDMYCDSCIEEAVKEMIEGLYKDMHYSEMANKSLL